MENERKVNGKVIRLMVGFITDVGDIDAMVYYARPDLALGSGFGTAIATQGGPKVQEELKKRGGAGVTDVVVTGGGNLKARFILHAVGPQFQEEQSEEKLAQTMRNTLQKAEEQKIERIVFPAMGTGFYGIPLDVCARVTLEAAKKHLEGPGSLREVLFCLRDSREYRPFQAYLQKMDA